MSEKQLYTEVLGISQPWRVTDVRGNIAGREVVVTLALRSNAALSCPICGKRASRYDKSSKRWRHLDSCEFRTYVEAEVPRVNCKKHGVNLIQVPWSEVRSRYTAPFEASVIDWLKDASISAVARHMSLSWNAIAGIQERAVLRSRLRRDSTAMVYQMGVDETSFRKGHDYVTVIHDGQSGAVVHVCEVRRNERLAAYYGSLSEQQREAVESVSMDMWPVYISATLETIPQADQKIAFDKFHVAKYLGDAVDKVRRSEHRALVSEGDRTLTGTEYDRLRNPTGETQRQAREQKAIRTSNLKTARAWAIKEHAMCLWHYASRTWVERSWHQRYGWAIRSRLEPVKKTARTIKTHLWGIVNAIVLDAHNGLAESINSKIKLVKVRSRGFRNKRQFAKAIHFHLGQLDLYPDGARNGLYQHN